MTKAGEGLDLEKQALLALGPWAEKPVYGTEAARAELIRNVIAALKRAVEAARQEERSRVLDIVCQAICIGCNKLVRRAFAEEER